MEFKVSPLILFVGIFIILALAVYFGKSISTVTEKESFIAFSKDFPALSKITVDTYSSTNTQVYKLFDNMYFDRINANTIDVFGHAYNDPTNNPTDILAIKVYTPDGYTSGFQVVGNVAAGNVTPLSESTISAIPVTYSNFIVNSISGNLAKQTSVVTWKKETFINVFYMDSTTNTYYVGLSAYIPSVTNSQIMSRFYDVTNTNTLTPTRLYPLTLRNAGDNSVSDLNDGKSSALTNYDSTKKVFQICKGVQYDATNSNIIVVNADGTITVYARPTSLGVNPTGATYPDNNNQPAKNTVKTVSSVSYAPWYFITPDNKYLVQYIAWGQNTIVTVFVLRNGIISAMIGSTTYTTPSYPMLSIHKTYRFNADGTIDGDDSVIQPSTINGNTNTAGNNNKNSTDASSNPLSDYYQWLAFWNTVANGSTANLSASNLVPKSSIVPPVCPSCPSCQISGNSVCVGCGGQGGSGTQGASLGTKAVSGTVNLLESAGSGTTQLLRDTGSGAANLARDTASGTANLARDAASGTVGLAKETASGTVGLAKDVVGGTVGLAKDTVGGIANVFGVQNPTQIQGQQQGQGYGGGAANVNSAYGQTIAGSDPYSYFGALPPKGSNYIPITADFSAFSK